MQEAFSQTKMPPLIQTMATMGKLSGYLRFRLSGDGLICHSVGWQDWRVG